MAGREGRVKEHLQQLQVMIVVTLPHIRSKYCEGKTLRLGDDKIVLGSPVMAEDTQYSPPADGVRRDRGSHMVIALGDRVPCTREGMWLKTNL